MMIGLNNIFTSFWFLLMIGSGLKIIFFIIPKFDSIDFWFGKFWMIVFATIVIGVIIFFLIKFRILIINKRKIISLFPFRLKITIINKTDIQSLNWYNVDQKAILHKCIQITDSKNNIIKFSDFEYENYHSLESKILGKQESNSERDNMIIEQAKNNLGYSKFLTLILLGLSLFLLGIMIKDYSYFELRLTILGIALILFFSSIKKTLKYIKIKKYGAHA